MPYNSFVLINLKTTKLMSYLTKPYFKDTRRNSDTFSELNLDEKIDNGHTRWSILFCLILAGSYDKNGISTGKKLVGMCSLYRDISPETVYLEI